MSPERRLISIHFPTQQSSGGRALGADTGLPEDRYEVAFRESDDAVMGFAASFLRIAAQKTHIGMITRQLYAPDGYCEARGRNSGFDRRSADRPPALQYS